MNDMTKYRLEDIKKRRLVDLRKHEIMITEIVQSVHPKAKVKVVADGYYLSDDISRGEKIIIGRLLAKTELGQYCLNRPVLFRGCNMSIENEDNIGVKAIEKHKRRKKP